MSIVKLHRFIYTTEVGDVPPQSRGKEKISNRGTNVYGGIRIRHSPRPKKDPRHYRRLYHDFIRFLFWQDHREDSVLGREIPEESDQFRFLRVVYLTMLLHPLPSSFFSTFCLRTVCPFFNDFFIKNGQNENYGKQGIRDVS